MTGPASERGAALVTVLLLVAIMSALIAVSFDRLSMAIRREGNRALAEEARLDLVSAEAIGAYRITTLENLTGGGSQPTGWNGQVVTVPVPGGRVIARVSDAGNCFNVNALTRFDETGSLVAQPIAITQFALLLELSGAPATDAARAAAAVTDWIDADSAPLPGGAEDEVYSALGFRTANAPITNVADLARIEGMKPLLARVADLLCALPEHAVPAYNINTLEVRHAALLAAALPELYTVAQAAELIRRRPANGFARVTDLADSSRRSSGTDFALPQLRTQTSWFRLEMMAELGDTRMREVALVDGRITPARVVRRSYGDVR
jgi:general secretion pathway protein K